MGGTRGIRKSNWGAHASQGRRRDGSYGGRGPNRIYAVKRGHNPGIYYSEQRARDQLSGYSGAAWRAFKGTEKSLAVDYLDESDISDSDD